ncbi:PEPxxWA-CTERM sorting domain-containing protein [Sphingomonas rhizophila]|nr:PEPxxWA-CTERM sorting domain-containing protein [Sphingomonas rhizophila]
MRSAMFSLLAGAAAAVALANPAVAAVTVTNTTGTPLANQIYGIDSNGTTVYGSSPNNNGIANVTFTANTTVHIGAGFAQINDVTPNTPDFYSLIINPDQDFTDFKWSVMLTGEGTVTVYYLATGSGLDANNLANYTSLAGSYAADGSNLNKLLSGGTFDGFAIVTNNPIAFFEIKQMTYNGVTAPPVPEPGTWAMMLLGFGAIGYGMRRRRSNGTVMQIA